MNILQVVTYKMLATHFKIHVNVAKQCLWSFKEARKDLSVIFFVSGFVKKGEQKVLLVKEKNLDFLLSKLTQTVSVHVYSVELDNKDKTKKSEESVDVSHDGEEAQGRRKIQGLISKYFVPNSSVKLNLTPSRKYSPWPKRQKMYQSTLWCPCEGSDDSGFFPKKVKQSFHLLDPNLDLDSGDDILVNEAYEVALAKDCNENKEPGGCIDSDNEDVNLSAVLEAVEAANGLALARDSNESKDPEGGIDSDNEDMNLETEIDLDSDECAKGSSTTDEKNNSDCDDEGRRKDILVNEAYELALARDSNESKDPEGGIDSDNEDMILSAVLEAVEAANEWARARDSNESKDPEGGIDSDNEDMNLSHVLEAVERASGSSTNDKNI